MTDSPLDSDPFRFVDLFAGIGGVRAGLERAGGRCVFSVELDRYARLTYQANWGDLDGADIRAVPASAVPDHDILAAGFPCQPFSLAGVSKKQSLGVAHGFDDPVSGNLFFQIVRLIGGPWDLGPDELQREAETPDDRDDEFVPDGDLPSASPPILLLENVRHLLSHDRYRTYRVVRRRLMQSGYRVSAQVVDAAAWVPQTRRRMIIIGVRRDLFDRPLILPAQPEIASGPKLTPEWFDGGEESIEKYRITPGVWAALRRHRARHERAGNGFGYSIVEYGRTTRTLSARYYKDGAEILVPMPDGSSPPRRLSPGECARLMGFSPEFLGKEFFIPEVVSDAQAYRQFGNAVVVPKFAWIAQAIVDQANGVLRSRRNARRLIA